MRLGNIPYIQDRSLWTYLGAPIGSQSAQCPSVKSALKKSVEVAEAVKSFARAYPAQALRILKHCLGACRVNHIAQSLPADSLTDSLFLPICASLKSCLSVVLGCPVSEDVWEQASLPSGAEMGGLGLQDPRHSAEAARLAGLINAAKTISRLGVPESLFQAAASQALAAYNQKWSFNSVMPKPAKDVQHELTLAVHKQRHAALVANASGPDAERLVSVSSPHAIDWTGYTSPWYCLGPEEYRFALRWVLGVPIQPGPYRCPSCGVMADRYGRHAVSCHLSGAAGRGHNVFKLTLASLYRLCGCEVSVFTEQGTEGSSERPADILVKGFQARPLAIDTTVWSRHLYHSDPLDAVVAAKLAHHKPLCSREGWTVRVCAADVYGFLHPLTTPVIQALAKRVAAKKFIGDAKLEAKAVWSAVSAAVVSRAASQLLRHAADDSNEDEDEVLGDQPTVPGQSTSSPAVNAVCSEDEDVPMGPADEGSTEDCPMDVVHADLPLADNPTHPYVHNPYDLPGDSREQLSQSQEVVKQLLQRKQQLWGSDGGQ